MGSDTTRFVSEVPPRSGGRSPIRVFGNAPYIHFPQFEVVVAVVVVVEYNILFKEYYCCRAGDRYHPFGFDGLVTFAKTGHSVEAIGVLKFWLVGPGAFRVGVVLIS